MLLQFFHGGNTYLALLQWKVKGAPGEPASYAGIRAKPDHVSFALLQLPQRNQMCTFDLQQGNLAIDSLNENSIYCMLQFAI